MKPAVLFAFSIFVPLLAATAQPAPVLVDGFDVTNGLSITNFGFQSGASFSSYDAPVDAVGGSRQAVIQIINNPRNTFDSVGASIANGVITYSSSAEAHGLLSLFYDQSGTGFTLDLASNFAGGDSFLITFGSPLSTPLSLLFSFQSGTNFGGADATQNIPVGVTSFTLPLSAFTPNPTFDPSSITTLTTRFAATTDGATYQIDRIAIVPEPATATLLIAAVGMFLLWRAKPSRTD